MKKSYVENNKLLRRAIECSGSTGIRGIIDTFEQADPKNKGVLKELHLVHIEYTEKHGWIRTKHQLLALLGLVLVLVGMFYMIKGMNVSHTTMEWGTVTMIVGMFPFFVGTAYLYWNRPSKNDTPMEFNGENYSSLDRFISFSQFVYSSVRVSDIRMDIVNIQVVRELSRGRVPATRGAEDPGKTPSGSVFYEEFDVDTASLKKLIDIWARQQIELLLENIEVQQRCSDESKRFDSQEEELRIRRELRRLSYSGFWVKDWTPVFKEVEAKMKKPQS